MPDSDLAVVIEKIIPGPPQKVFEAWLDPEALRRFMCGAPGIQVSRVECDPRVDGKFLIVMSVGDRDIPHQGEYLEIERYTRLVFSWRSMYAGEGSRVTLHFAASPGGQTKLTLEHVGLGDAENRARHHEGWSNILKELSELEGLKA